MAQATDTLSEFAQQLGELINESLDRYLELDSGCPDRLREGMHYSLMAGGKRLRPMLVLLAAQACRADIKSALAAACAVEMIHTYSLIHDDLPSMDDDDLRRGLPTNHKVYGEANAILAGDALLTLAFEVMARDIQPANVAAACCAALAKAAGATGMVGGQSDDIAAEEEVLSVNISELSETEKAARLQFLEAIHKRKTGALLAVSLKLGGLVAGASEEELNSLQKYGENIGLAFQITDDLLDVHGDEETIGKAVNKDDGKGKLTFPNLLGIEESQRRAKEHIATAIQAVERFSDAGQRLVTLANYILERDR